MLDISDDLTDARAKLEVARNALQPLLNAQVGELAPIIARLERIAAEVARVERVVVERAAAGR